MRLVSMDEASNAMATRARNSNSVHLLSRWEVERGAQGGRRQRADRWGTPPNVSEPLRMWKILSPDRVRKICSTRMDQSDCAI